MICSICQIEIKDNNKSNYSHLCKECYNEFKTDNEDEKK
jgi:hypothetical protein